MNATTRLSAAFAAGILTLCGAVIGADPALARVGLVNDFEGAFSAFGAGDGSYVWLCNTNIPAASCDSTNFSYTMNLSQTYSFGTLVYAYGGDLVSLPDTTCNVSMGDNTGPRSSTLTNVVIGLGGDGPCGPNADLSSATSGPPLILQQVGLAPSGSCTTFTDVNLNWGGAESGGWTQSWAQWLNDGRGGLVCTRTLVYDNSVNHWVIAA